MKRLFVTLFAGICLASCGGNSSDGEAKIEDKKDTMPAELAKEEPKDPEAEKGLSLVAQSDCLTCHKVDETVTGPAYRAVADRYRNHTDATVDSLATKIITGGAGNWGQVPMSPHPQLSKDDARTMVKYVLSLNSK